MKILHIQHAAVLGGSCVSSVLTLKELQSTGHTAIVALARPTGAVIKYYQNSGFEPIQWPLACWNHSTVSTLRCGNPFDLWKGFKLVLGWRKSKKRTLELVNAFQPDLVHLNSMPLSASASALADGDIPFVWHVREPPADQGWQTRKIRSIMQRAPSLVFISEFDRQQWMGEPRGEIVRNFVDFERFHPRVDGNQTRKDLEIQESQRVLLYVGGIAEVKGCFVLLEALAALKKYHSNLVCLMPGTFVETQLSLSVRTARRVLPLIGSETQTQRFNRMIVDLGLEHVVRRIPFRNDMQNLIAAADVMLFPAKRPHFARPIIEAAALAKPSIGSDLGGMNELIRHKHSGLLVRAGCFRSLAGAIVSLLENPDECRRFGQLAYKQALKEFDCRAQVKNLKTIFEKVRQVSR